MKEKPIFTESYDHAKRLTKLMVEIGNRKWEYFVDKEGISADHMNPYMATVKKHFLRNVALDYAKPILDL